MRVLAMNTARIVSDPKIMLGKPTIAGTRITVEYVLEELAHGQSFDALLSSHPTLTRDGIQAALDYAVKVLRLDIVDPVEAG
jgi:uncharacterized protein (DUF433 family)